jgi:hypothetical protein
VSSSPSTRLNAQGPGPIEEDLETLFELMAVSVVPAAKRANITVHEIRWERCVCCDQPATNAHFNLKRRERVLVCDACRPPK